MLSGVQLNLKGTTTGFQHEHLKRKNPFLSLLMVGVFAQMKEERTLVVSGFSFYSIQ